jgi:hypothetical protein
VDLGSKKIEPVRYYFIGTVQDFSHHTGVLLSEEFGCCTGICLRYYLGSMCDVFSESSNRNTGQFALKP